MAIKILFSSLSPGWLEKSTAQGFPSFKQAINNISVTWSIIFYDMCLVKSKAPENPTSTQIECTGNTFTNYGI